MAEYDYSRPRGSDYHVKGTGVQLYAIQRGGELKQYPQVEFIGNGDLPSDGILSNPNDKPLVTEIQDKMIDTYGHAIVERFCGKAKEGEKVRLDYKLLRPQHVGSLMAAVEKHQVAKLLLNDNQLGPEGGAKLAEALKTNTTLTKLDLPGNQLGPEGIASLAEALKTNTTLTTLDLERNKINDQAALAAIESILEANKARPPASVRHAFASGCDPNP